MIKTQSIRRALFLLTVLSCLRITAQSAGFQLLLNVPEPVAVDGLPDGGYYILTRDNAIYRYAATSAVPGIQFSSKFSPDMPGKSTDLAFARMDGRDSIIVTEWAESLKLGHIFQYSPSGKVMATWFTHHIPTGVDFDSANGQIYFVTRDSNELFRADIGTHDLRQVCDVRGASGLGPLALDISRHLAYTSDESGRLFAIDLTSKKVKRLEPSFGLASTLRLDSQRQMLYVVDRVKKRIYAIDMSREGGRIVGESRQLRNPSGAALGPANSLLVTDDGSDGVYWGRVGSLENNNAQKLKSRKKTKG